MRTTTNATQLTPERPVHSRVNERVNGRREKHQEHYEQSDMPVKSFDELESKQQGQDPKRYPTTREDNYHDKEGNTDF